MKPNSQKFNQKRRFYMALPVLVIPFMTMFFWALGGGEGIVNVKDSTRAGLNMSLPNAKFVDEVDAWDKLSLYQKARRDSLKANQAKRSDPYFRLSTLKVKQDTAVKDSTKRRGAINLSLGERKQPIDETEAKVYKKLEELQKQIDGPNQVSTKRPVKKQKPEETDLQFQTDVDRLEGMMLMMQQGQAEDEEMQEINTVLNKILDIQHPERVKERLSQGKVGDHTYYVNAQGRDHNISLLRDDASIFSEFENESNGFFGLEGMASAITEHNAIKAEVYGNQTLVSGSVIKLVLLQDIRINEITVPKNTFVFGECALNGERLIVDITSIQHANSILPVSLLVHDVDGLEGIYVPGAITRDAAKKSSNQTLQEIQLNSLDPSLEIQAASAGIEAAKGILTKKTRMIQVTAKAGYQVYLVNKNNKLSKP